MVRRVGYPMPNRDREGARPLDANNVPMELTLSLKRGSPISEISELEGNLSKVIYPVPGDNRLMRFETTPASGKLFVAYERNVDLDRRVWCLGGV